MRDYPVDLGLEPAGAATERPISVAIVAMGGQGGGVLTDWIVALAEGQGWVAQSTSVPGVAQRTGATIYYVEAMRPDAAGRKPVLAQMPTPGDVDVVLAAEYMEAGRSILRGIVTPDRTTLIASSHRTLAIDEKMAPGEGIADSGAVDAAIGITARHRIVFDMEALARRNGSVISAAMFGALAASGTLPFPRAAFEDVIRSSGKGVEASLKAFGAACDRAATPVELASAPGAAAPSQAHKVAAADLPAPPETLADPRANALLQQLRRDIPAAVQPMAYAGLVKVASYQDAAYGAEYLGLLRQICAEDAAQGGAARGYAYGRAGAKYLANAMCFDDIFRVADLKTRASRRARVAQEVGLKDGQILQTTEFFHPRAEELVSLLPVGLAARISANPGLYGWLSRRIDKGRRVRSYSLGWFVVLYTLGGMKRFRRGSARYAVEVAHRARLLQAAAGVLPRNYDLACRILTFQRLIKGYSDTHARGLTKFDKVLSTVLRIADRPDAADWADRLMKAAIHDASGAELEGAIQTIESFA